MLPCPLYWTVTSSISISRLVIIILKYHLYHIGVSMLINWQTGNILMISEGRPGVDTIYTLSDGQSGNASLSNSHLSALSDLNMTLWAGILRIELDKSIYEKVGIVGKAVKHGGRTHVKERYRTFPLPFQIFFPNHQSLTSMQLQSLSSISAFHRCYTAKRGLRNLYGHPNKFWPTPSLGCSVTLIQPLITPRKVHISSRLHFHPLSPFQPANRSSNDH